ncbi:hypothetical protein N7495_005926 [Penicillium taxi]|uniref:uncharacterized protein n=1 Tax=Penicillium taxi TaxID=168475 RepID=UPI0025457D6A|nr:uncharacterized protein N7495_005926 [Penicillium taxi]KAJ5894235.1 hypothetical protein N7495_005926 [Penicillium taxi]
MAKRYTIDELIWLRASPLVAKPVGLPPNEDWMPQPDPTPQRKQQSSRDPNSPELTTNRRPSFFEARHISRGSNSEDIVLGPPKIAFASSRVGGKGSLDSSDRSVRLSESDEKTDRFTSNFRERLAKDKDTPDRDFDRRDGKAALNTRRGDKEDWNAGRQRRTFGSEDQDRKSKRNGEFDRWEASPRDANNERTTRDKDSRFSAKKDAPPGRGKLEGSWFRDENSHSNLNSNSHSNEFAADADDDKPPVRSREWRRNQHDADRDWARGPKEKDPEWMDSNGKDDSSRAHPQAHTQHDFERWKQRMKASSGAQTSNENVEEPAEHFSTQESEIPPGVNHGFMADNTMDRFFGTLDPRQAGQEIDTPDSAERKDGAGKLAKSSSRFAGLFSPMPESPAKGPEPQPVFMPMQVPMPSSNGITKHNDADQEGFQRILQMLGGGGGGGGGNGGSRSNNDTPNHPDSAYRERPPAQQDPRFVASVGPHRQEYNNQDTREREHLLRLMQQVRLGSGPSQQSQNGGLPLPPPGLMPEIMTRPPPGLTGGPKNSGFPDDPAIANIQGPDNEYLRRRAPNGPPMGYFDESTFHQMNPGQGPITPGGSRQPQGPLLQRPPGLEHMPPPGWTGQPHPQQGNGLNSMGHPPGIPPSNRGGMTMPNFPPGMMPPMQGNGPQMNDRQGWRGPPPGMMPPHGYMGGHPPPGFPPMPPNPEAMMGFGPGGQGPFGPGNPGQQGPQGPQGPPSARQLLDMFGQPSGGMMGPGPGPAPGPFR